MRDEVMGQFKAVHNNKPCNLHTLSSTTTTKVKSMGLKWARYVDQIGKRKVTQFFLEKEVRRQSYTHI